MIFGITHSDTGEVIQRLSVSTKIAVGLPPSKASGRKAPMKLDHFLFLRRTNKSEGMEAGWEIDPELTRHYEQKTKSKTPREIEVILVNDELEEVFATKLAWWTATQCKCWGDGQVATRRTEANPKGEAWAPEQAPCGKDCPDLKEARCKPSGDLRFMLADFPQLGAIARIHTTSYKSVSQIHSALQQVQTITGGRLAGIKANLVVRAEKTSYQGKDNARHSTIVPILSLEIKADGLQKMMSQVIEGAKVFQETRKLLGGHVLRVEEDDDAIAGEISQEFYHDDDASVAVEPHEKRQARRERERATLEPGKQPNRGHGKEAAPRPPAPEPPTETFSSGEPVPIQEPDDTPQQAPQPEGDPMEQMCENCEVPHPRFNHEGDNGDGPCTECMCQTFSSIPPQPKFDTVWANDSKAAEPKWVEMRRVVGKVVKFENTDRDGALLKTGGGAQFVIVHLLHLTPDETKDPNAKFFCFHQSLIDPLQMALGEKVAIVYQVKPGKKAGVVYQMVHDIMQVGAQTFFGKKADAVGAGIRGTVRTVDPMNQESMFNAEDENQAS